MSGKWSDRLVKPSTRRFAEEARRTPGYTWFDFVHGYVYGRWPYLYIGIGTGEHRLAKAWARLSRWFARLSPRRPAREADEAVHTGPQNGRVRRSTPGQLAFSHTYHGKVVPLQPATQLVSVREAVSLGDLEQVIPYQRARDIILQNPDHIVALDCPCRVSRVNPCLPLDVCLIVGEPFAGFVREHQPERTRWISPAEAVGILQAEDARGHVHHAFFKDAMFGRFYAICNCCACCCGAMQAQRNGTPMLASSGYLSHVDEDLCIGCGECAAFCQFGALSVPATLAVVDGEACMGCGVCVGKCEQGALSLAREPAKGIPLDIRQLIGLATSDEQPRAV